MSEQKIQLPSVEEKQSLCELRIEKAKQARQKDLTLWPHNGINHKEFIKKLQDGLATVKEGILSNVNLDKDTFFCDFKFSFDPFKSLRSDHAEGFILPEYLSRQTEMEFRGWCSENNLSLLFLEISADSGPGYRNLIFNFEVCLSKPYQYDEMPFEPKTEGFAFVEE